MVYLTLEVHINTSSSSSSSPSSSPTTSVPVLGGVVLGRHHQAPPLACPPVDLRAHTHPSTCVGAGARHRGMGREGVGVGWGESVRARGAGGGMGRAHTRGKCGSVCHQPTAAAAAAPRHTTRAPPRSPQCPRCSHHQPPLLPPPSAATRHSAHRLHNVDKLLLVCHGPVDLVVVACAQVDHDVLRQRGAAGAGAGKAAGGRGAVRCGVSRGASERVGGGAGYSVAARRGMTARRGWGQCVNVWERGLGEGVRSEAHIQGAHGRGREDVGGRGRVSGVEGWM